MKVLLVEDEVRVARFIEKGLREEGHVVDVVHDGLEATALARVGSYDAMILDVMLPGRSGFHVASELRRGGSPMPILMLTARDSRQDVVHGLDLGADDYLTKPFDFEELLARLRAITRRGVAVDDGLLRFGDIELDRRNREVRRGGERLHLTPTEFRLLDAVMSKGGQVVKRIELLDRVWGMSFDPGTNLIDVHMVNLRRKLESGGRPRIIATIRGVGFRMDLDGLREP